MKHIEIPSDIFVNHFDIYVTQIINQYYGKQYVIFCDSCIFDEFKGFISFQYLYRNQQPAYYNYASLDNTFITTKNVYDEVFITVNIINNRLIKNIYKSKYKNKRFIIKFPLDSTELITNIENIQKEINKIILKKKTKVDKL